MPTRAIPDGSTSIHAASNVASVAAGDSQITNATPRGEVPLGPRYSGQDPGVPGHGGAGHVSTIANLRSGTALSNVRPNPGVAPILSLDAIPPPDPRVAAALAKVPGMVALKGLSPRDMELGSLGAKETARMIKSGELDPMEVFESAVRRCEASEYLGGISLKMYDQARALVEQGDLSGPLAYVPTAYKANARVKGTVTTYGSRAVPNVVAKKSTPDILDFDSLGGVALLKTQCSEFGFNGVVENVGELPTRNPFSIAHTSGGSSGGAAVAVATGALPFAHTTDGGGSTRIPAGLNNLFGMKPSKGRLTELANAKDLPMVFNSAGVVTRNAEDLAAVLNHLDRGQASGLKPLNLVDGPPQQPLKVGYYINPIGGKTDPEVRSKVLETVDKLRAQGHTVEQMEPPYTKQFVDDFLALYRLVAWGARRKLRKDKNSDASKLEPFSQGLADLNLFQVAKARVLSVARLKGKHLRRYEKAFKKHDIILSPTTGTPAPKVGELSPSQSYDDMIEKLMDFVAFTPLQNASGGPAVSVPAGFSSDGRPIGVQLAAAHGEDAQLLELAFALEDNKD